MSKLLVGPPNDSQMPDIGGLAAADRVARTGNPSAVGCHPPEVPHATAGWPGLRSAGFVLTRRGWTSWPFVTLEASAMDGPRPRSAQLLVSRLLGES